MKNEKQTKDMENIIVHVFTDNHGKVTILYTLPGLQLRTQIIERLITQYSKN
jgi:hypothetical protein